MHETVRLWLGMFALHIPVYFFWDWVLFRHWADFWNAIDFRTETESRSWNAEEYWHDAYYGRDASTGKRQLRFVCSSCRKSTAVASQRLERP